MPKQARQPSGVHEDRSPAGPDLATLNRGDETGERLRRVDRIKNESCARVAPGFTGIRLSRCGRSPAFRIVIVPLAGVRVR
jgi:hypothetical protein